MKYYYSRILYSGKNGRSAICAPLPATSALPTLPPELLLLIAESAEASEPPTRSGWVAALCRVCKSLHRAATPILYAHIVFTRHNFHLLVKLACDSPVLFAYVRSATFTWSVGPCTTYDFQPIARAMKHLRAFAGPLRPLGFMLENSDDDLCFSSLSITGAISTLASGFLDYQRVFRMATRLHVVSRLSNTLDVSRDMKTEYLILDIRLHRSDDESGRFVRVLRRVEYIIDTLPSLRRILIRTRTHEGFDVTFFHLGTEKRATAKHEPRVWIDDSSANGAIPWDVDATALEDAAAGDGLWLTGRQIYSAPLPLRKA